ncbi:hypothetical protein Gorai_014599, partial [Gossypium raimondii]|nr:hypothetical protein [Gossypium raimondii]
FAFVVCNDCILFEEATTASALVLQQSTRQWDERLLTDVLGATVANLVLCIPLSQEAHDDILANCVCSLVNLACSESMYTYKCYFSSAGNFSEGPLLSPGTGCGVRESCIGLMFRDKLGRVIGSHLMLTAHVPSAFTAEALACLHAVRLAVDLNLQEVIFEGDSLTVIQKACSPLHDISTIRAYIQVVKAMTFRRCLFVYIPRKGNSFVHLLATTGLCGEVCSSLSRVIPNFAYLAVERELPV